YQVYGINVHSQIELALPTYGCGGLGQVEVQTASSSYFSDVIQGVSLERIHGSWYEIGRLEDESIYARWTDVGEFLVSRSGRRIVCRQFDAATKESFDVYLLGQALSFALVQSGFEPLHATVIVIDGAGIALLGQSGYGKSTLAASFLAA